MTKLSWKCFFLFVIAAFSNTSKGASEITIEELATGYLDIHIVMSNMDLKRSSPVQNNKSYGFTILLIPFEYTKEWEISSAQDVIVSNISTFKGYSLISAIFPSTKTSDLNINIRNGLKLSENREGKAKIIVDIDYPYLSDSVKDLTELNFVFNEWNFTFKLLKKYENDEVSKSNSIIKRSGDKTYEIKYGDMRSLSKKETWMVFPNARQRALDKGKLVISLLVGVLTIFLQFSFIRDRKISVVLGVFAISGLVVGASVYYAHFLSKGFELAVWGAVLIPHVLMSFLGAIYVLIARFKQAIISVPVQKGGVPIDFCEVVILGKNVNNWEPIEKIEKLTNGNGYFHLWLRKKYSTYKVIAKTTRTQASESSEFSASPRERVQLDLINLV